MAPPKLSANQLRRIEEIQGYQKAVAHIKKLVAELESSAAARPLIIQNLSSRIARECSRIRQRALTANIGTVGDVAGALSTMAGRSHGLQLKIRGLIEGVASLTLQLDHALTVARTPEQKQPSDAEPAPE